MTVRTSQINFLRKNGYQWIVDKWLRNEDADPNFLPNQPLIEAFCWDDSPEGEDFWLIVDDCLDTYDVSALLRSRIYPKGKLYRRWCKK